MNKPGASSKTNEFHWVVDFRIRPSDERQVRLIDMVGQGMLYRLAGLWVTIVGPDARELEANEMVATRRIAFRTRAAARKFLGLWGGTLRPRLTSILNYPTVRETPTSAAGPSK